MSNAESKKSFSDYLNLIIPLVLLIIILIGVIIFQFGKPLEFKEELPSSVNELVELTNKELKQKYPSEDLKVGFQSTSEDYDKFIKGDYDLLYTFFRPSDKDIESYLVSSNGLAVIAHPSNAVNDVSEEQLNQILKGEMNNWKQLEWEDKKIKIYLPDNILASVYPGEEVLKSEEYKGSIELLDEARLVETVSRETGSIGLVDYLSAKDKPIKFIGYNGLRPSDRNISELQYTLMLKIYLLVKKENVDEITEFLTSEEFKEKIRETGLLTLPTD